MKNKFIILILVVALGLAAFFVYKNKTKEVTETPLGVTSGIPISGHYCFSRTQKATAAAPYSVEEYVVLNFDGTKVTGTKRGTQAGPDMTNGYEGTLTGATIEDQNEMELTYAYTVEGSQNKELEVYTIENKNLIKKRWVLKDQKINGVSILVPDYVGEPTLIIYTPLPCDGASFGTAQTFKIGVPIEFTDGLSVELKKVDDSRCKPNVQCIWAGELGPILRVSGGSFGNTRELRLGTTTTTNITLSGYTFLLHSATATSANITITKM